MSMPSNAVYWYVLYVRTGWEEKLVDELKYRLIDNEFRPFVLKSTHVFRRHGEKSLFQKVCFPGYVFIESNKPPEKFVARMFGVVQPIKYVYKILRHGDDRLDVAMRDDERLGLSRLFGEGFCTDVSKGFRDGDFVKIVSGSRDGMKSRIMRINKKRQEALVEVTMFNNVMKVLVGLDVIEKV